MRYLQAQQLDTAGNWSDAGCVALTQLSDDRGVHHRDSQARNATQSAVRSSRPLWSLLCSRRARFSAASGSPPCPKSTAHAQVLSPVYFHYDVPSGTSFRAPLTASITGSITISRGDTPTSRELVSPVTGTASGVVSYFYNSAHGIAALSGNVIAPVDEITSGRSAL